MVTKCFLFIGLVACTNTTPYPYLQSSPADARSADVGIDTPLAYPLWSTANKVLASSWCALELRCGEGEYDLAYGSGSAAAEACEQTNADALCYGEWEGFAQCEGVYPQKQIQYMDACPADSAAAPCFSAWDEGLWAESCELAAPWSM